jgi:hypothetical protein
MQDCEQVEAAMPIRQGDVLKRVENNGTTLLVVVVTADCDIANNKLGDAGLACVQLAPLADYMLNEHARTIANRQIGKRFVNITTWINKRWLERDPQNTPLTEESVLTWLTSTSLEEIETKLGLPAEDKKSFLKREIPALLEAQALLSTPKDKFAAIDALRALQLKTTPRSEQLKSLFGSLDPSDLPLDMFFVLSIPGEPGVGFIAKLRALSFVPMDQSFTSMRVAKEFDNSFVRVGRLASTFRHGLAQQFGMLFARIGLPKAYEADREAAFAVIAEQIANEMGKDQ